MQFCMSALKLSLGFEVESQWRSLSRKQVNSIRATLSCSHQFNHLIIRGHFSQIWLIDCWANSWVPAFIILKHRDLNSASLSIEMITLLRVTRSTDWPKWNLQPFIISSACSRSLWIESCSLLPFSVLSTTKST